MTLSNIYLYAIPIILLMLLCIIVWLLLSKKITPDLIIKNNESMLHELNQKIEAELDQYYHQLKNIQESGISKLNQNFDSINSIISQQNQELERLKNEIKKRDSMLYQRNQKIQKLKDQNANSN